MRNLHPNPHSMDAATSLGNPFSPSMEATHLAPGLDSLRWAAMVLGAGNVGLVLLCGYLMVWQLLCFSEGVKLPFILVSLVACLRVLCMVGAASAQVATASAIVACRSPAVDAVVRNERRVRYKRWLWWTRFGMGITMLQFIAAFYLMLIIIKDFSHNSTTKQCYLGEGMEMRAGTRMSVVLFLVLAWLVAIIQCFTGSNVLRWRSFYSTCDEAWKAHYLEVFDHGIREVMCCLGRVKYLSILEEDEVYSVARLLGDLVAYRASGTGHLEFLAGLALLQRCKQSHFLRDELGEAPEARIGGAAAYHHFAEAAYTGPLLDFGRNPFLFPCVWIRRQAVLTPWTRNRRPLLEGDNWWRGHAAAFLKSVNLHPESLRQGRIRQTKREAAYFVVVLHKERTVVIAVRGTETPEDILTDSLCKECALTDDDLDGLINGCVASEVREKVLSSVHHGHSGIVESARELFMQLEECHEINDAYHSRNTGLLSSLLGEGEECHGYRICIVGHSLGGSVAALLGIKLYRRFPNLHVYAYGPLPCVDPIVAEACSGFVTSIVYNDEFSARLSVNSIFRLQAAAVAALSDDSSVDSTMTSKFVRQIFNVNRHQVCMGNHNDGNIHSKNLKVEAHNHVQRRNLKHAAKGGAFLCTHAVSCMVNMPTSRPSSPSKRRDCDIRRNTTLASNGTHELRAPKAAKGAGGHIQESHFQEDILLFGHLNSENAHDNFDEIRTEETMVADVFAENGNETTFSERSRDFSFGNCTSSCTNGLFSPLSDGDTPEMFLPGLVVHVVPEQNSIFPQWNGWKLQDKKSSYRAFVARRENFKDISVTPFMFLDHLPWRCHYALHKVLEAQIAKGQLSGDLLNGLHAV